MVVFARICAPVLALLLLVLPVLAVDTQEASDPDVSASEVLDGDVDGASAEDEADPGPVGPTELDYLVSINTYMTYLFGFGAVGIAWLGFRLMYIFLNFFF